MRRLNDLEASQLRDAFYYVQKDVSILQIKDLLSAQEKDQLQSINKSMQHRKQKKKRKKKPKPERLSQRDLHDLMGTNRDIYERRNGAVRRK